MNGRKWIALVVILALVCGGALLADGEDPGDGWNAGAMAGWTEDGGYTPAGRRVTLKQPMETRSGPGSYYTELGSYFQAGTAVTALSAAYDDVDGTWWIQTEFTYNGETRRAYTDVEQLQMAAGDVPAEPVRARDAVMSRSEYAYWGPGYGYAMYHQRIPAGTEGKVWFTEGEYAQFEFYDAPEAAWRRVWVPASALEAFNG